MMDRSLYSEELISLFSSFLPEEWSSAARDEWTAKIVKAIRDKRKNEALRLFALRYGWGPWAVHGTMLGGWKVLLNIENITGTRFRILATTDLAREILR